MTGGAYGRWDKQEFLVERICTCTDRTGECGDMTQRQIELLVEMQALRERMARLRSELAKKQRHGYHAVDGFVTQSEAEDDARILIHSVGVAYRVRHAPSGEIVWAGRPAFAVAEYKGKGDRYFGGNADDRPLGVTGAFLTGCYSLADVAYFDSKEEALAAAASASNRREGAIIGAHAALEERRPLELRPATGG